MNDDCWGRVFQHHSFWIRNSSFFLSSSSVQTLSVCFPKRMQFHFHLFHNFDVWAEDGTLCGKVPSPGKKRKKRIDIHANMLACFDCVSCFNFAVPASVQLASFVNVCSKHDPLVHRQQFVTLCNMSIFKLWRFSDRVIDIIWLEHTTQLEIKTLCNQIP